MLSSSVPSRLFGTGPQRSLPSSTVWPNRTKRRASVRSYFGQTKALRSAMALRSAKQNRTEAVCSVLFDRTVPKGREVLGAKEGRCRRAEGAPGERAGVEEPEGAPGEHVLGSGGRVLGKGEETGERGTVLGRGKGAVPERRRREDGLGGYCWGGEKTGVASEGGKETEVASEGREETGPKGIAGEGRRRGGVGRREEDGGGVGREGGDRSGGGLWREKGRIV